MKVEKMDSIRWWTFGILLCLSTSIIAEENISSEIETSHVSESRSGFSDLIDYILGFSSNLQARTFGVKRLQFMLMPMVYKMGVMMTLMIVLTVISLKGLMIGVMLLVLKLSAIFGKFYASIQPQHHASWSPAQPVHLHLHNNGGQNVPYSAWEPPSISHADDSHYYKGY